MSSMVRKTRDAFRLKLKRTVGEIAKEVDADVAREFLSHTDPKEGLRILLEELHTRAAIEGEDPLAGARMRGLRGRARLIEQAGGMLRLGQAAQTLGVTSQAVTGRRQRGTILAVQMRNGEWVYPACQFSPSGLVEGLPDFLDAFHPDTVSWTRLGVLLAGSERFDGASPLDLLSSGRVEDAVSLAATYGVQG